jgi:hypothetical protein
MRPDGLRGLGFRFRADIPCIPGSGRSSSGMGLADSSSGPSRRSGRNPLGFLQIDHEGLFGAK